MINRILMQRYVFVLFLVFCTSVFAKKEGFVDEYDLRFRNGRHKPVQVQEPEGDQQASIEVFPDMITNKISPLNIGYNIEDLNYQIYTGLYAQMIYGESFEEEPDLDIMPGWKWMSPQSGNMCTADDKEYQKRWGYWAVEDGVLTLTGMRSARVSTDSVRIKEGVIECDIRQPSLTPGNHSGNLYFCLSERDAYFLVFWPRIARCELRRWRGSSYGFYGDSLAGGEMDIATDKWYHIKVVIRDGFIKIFIDDMNKPKIRYKTTEELEGGVGFDTACARASIRNFTVRTDEKQWQAKFDSPPYSHNANISRWWDPVVTGSADVVYKWHKGDAYNTERSQVITFAGGTGTAGVANRGLKNWGLYFDKGKEYAGRLYLKGDYPGKVTLALQNADGSKTYAKKLLKGVDKAWKKFEFSMKADGTEENGRLAIWIDRPGTIAVDQVVLMPMDKLYVGLPVRDDLGKLIQATASHLRFGGDMIGDIEFDWRTKIGDPDKRVQSVGPWNRRKSYGWGIFEFLEFCEAAGIVAIPNLWEGREPQYCADFVEFCNGGPDTKWGKVRIEQRRKKAYNIQFLHYGNGVSSLERQYEVTRLVKKVDTNVKVITGDIGGWPQMLFKPDVAKEWADKLHGKIHSFGMRSENFNLESHLLWEDVLKDYIKRFLDDYPGCKTKLYIEEVNSKAYNWQRAIANAVYINTAEKYGRYVEMLSFCNAMQADKMMYSWDQGHIFFNNRQAWFQPCAWVLKLAKDYLQVNRIESNVTCPEVIFGQKSKSTRSEAAGQTGPSSFGVKYGKRPQPAMSVGATVNDNGDTIVLKIVNQYSKDLKTEVSIKGLKSAKSAKMVMLKGALEDVNTAENPGNIVPAEFVLEEVSEKFSYTFPAYSYSIVEVKRAF